MAAILLCTIGGLALAGILLLSRRKKRGLRDLQLVGSQGVVNSKLNPEGTVLLRGEVWRACSRDGSEIDVQRQVQIVGTRDHLLLVDLV